MSDFVSTIKYAKGISVVFSIESDEIMAIGEKLEEINPAAYMNGYNWEAFLNYYLQKNAPDVIINMGTDPEAGMYSAYYPLGEENEARAEKLASIIRNLAKDEEELCRIVREEGDSIEWD